MAIRKGTTLKIVVVYGEPGMRAKSVLSRLGISLQNNGIFQYGRETLTAVTQRDWADERQLEKSITAALKSRGVSIIGVAVKQSIAGGISGGIGW